MYELHIKSGIERISPEVLNIFLRLSGYDALKENDDNTIKFDDLKSAQKAEVELRKMFTCFVIEISPDLHLIPKQDTNKYRIIHLKSFKENGKWYDEFDIKLPYDIKGWDIPSYIRAQKDYLTFVLYGHYANNVPFLVLPKQKPVDEWNYSEGKK